MWFDIRNVLTDKYLIYILIGGRGIGKTFSAVRWAVTDFLETGKQAIYLRRRAVDIERAVDDFGIYADFAEGKKYNVTKDCIFIDEKPAIFIRALSTAKRSGVYSGVNKIIYDEAIPEDGSSYLANEFSKLLNFRETVERLRVKENGDIEDRTSELVTLVLLGNNSSKYNLWTSRLNVDLGSADKFTRDELYYEILKNSEEYEKARSKSRFSKFIENTEDFSYMYQNKDIQIDYSNVKSLPPNASPLANLTILGYDLSVYEKTNDFFVSVGKSSSELKLNDDKKSLAFYKKSLVYLLLKMAQQNGHLYFRNKKAAELFFNIFDK